MDLKAEPRRARWALAVSLMVAALAAFAELEAQSKSAGRSRAPIRCRNAGCGIIDAQLICGPTPELPPLAKAAHLEGTVRITAAVDEDGEVQVLQLISGHPFLVTAAMEAAKRYRFKPATMRGTPIESIQLLDVGFKETSGRGPGKMPLSACTAVSDTLPRPTP